MALTFSTLLSPTGDSTRKPAMPSGLRPPAPFAARALPVLQPQRTPSQLSLFPPPGVARGNR